MLYGDRGYCIAYARRRTKEASGRASMSGGRNDHAKEEDSGVPGRFDANDAGRGVSAIRLRWIWRAP